MKNIRTIATLALVALIPVAPLLFGFFFATGDMRDVFIPLEMFFHAQEVALSIPAWNPAVSFGFPVIAAAQIGFFYPPLFLARILPIWLELPIIVPLHIVASAVGMFFFAQRLSRSVPASFLAAISFSLSQAVFQHVTHLNIFLAVAWTPWQMIAVDVLFRRKVLSGKSIATLIPLFGIPFLIGQIQVPLLSMASALLYGAYIRQKERYAWVMPTLILGIAVFLFAAVQLFPTFELARLSSRGTSGGFDIVRANQHSYPLYHMPTVLFPRFYGNDSTYWGKRLEIEYGSYIGVIPLFFAAWATISFFKKKGSSSGLFFVWLLLGAFLLSLGGLSPIRLLGIEPSLWIFSAPARYMIFGTFAACILAAYGFDLATENTKSIVNLSRKWALSIVVALLLVNIALLYGDSTLSAMQHAGKISLHAQEKLTSMLSSARMSSISLLSPFSYIPIVSFVLLPVFLRKKKLYAIVALACVDLVLIASTTSPLVHWKDVLSSPETISQLPLEVTDHSSRVYSITNGGDTGAYFTDPSSRANAAIRTLQKNLLVPMVSSQFDIYGTQWPASLDLAEQESVLEQLRPNGTHAIENTSLAQQLSIGAALAPGNSDSVTVTHYDPAPRVERVGGIANIISEHPMQITIHTQAKDVSDLIVRDTFYPGWHAYVDDVEIPIVKAPLFFRTMHIPAGEHTVRLSYSPVSLYLGGAITLITIAVCGILSKRTNRL